MVTQSPEPEVHVLCVRAFRVALEFRSAGFWGKGKTKEHGGKPLGAEEEPTTNSAHLWPLFRTERAPHRWEASALTTAPALLFGEVVFNSKTKKRAAEQPEIPAENIFADRLLFDDEDTSKDLTIVTFIYACFTQMTIGMKCYKKTVNLSFDC